MSDFRVPRNGRTTKEAAEITGLSTRSIQRWTSVPRDQWLQEKADEREAMRAYHDDEHHSWSETGRHFGIDPSTARRRAFRARKERAREAEEAAKGPTLFDIDLDEVS
ncbi:hypothetical protein O6R08_07745 [Cutibacterium equinum]|uniref:Uncharacterized protein n=1 Tax=Cutibacterium equinum TaxID=3016342 RepID=A0ABY7QWM7_9ACTN|nr:hypothetical protein [Cutibacterium equinum]WCC79411.1 hypothetical protein O6R08_07745 [Cutibacterium equinum]